MAGNLSNRYREIWLVDFEFMAPPGERPTPVCLVAHEFKSGNTLRVWQDDLNGMVKPPYPVGEECLFVDYYASAEMGCHVALGWPLPRNVLDLFTEFRNLTNGISLPCGSGLLGALAFFGENGIEAAEKESTRNLVLRGGPWTPAEQMALLEYCESDVKALSKLLLKMAPVLDLPRALLRGRYMKGAAWIEHYGIPIDMEALGLLRTHWEGIQDKLIMKVDENFGVYEGRTFKAIRFAEWLARSGIPWPRLDSGALDLKDDTFREMARNYARVAPLHELRVALSQMRLSDLAVGKDGRNRSLLSAFRARTGRNQPSNARFIFGPTVWLRGLIRPEPGYALAYIDWSQQEFGIAAALSGDPLMMEAYHSGDPYLAFAKQARAVPSDSTREIHGQVRELFKSAVLAVQYGMGAESLANRIGRSVADAEELLRLHRETYLTFWKWSDGTLDYAMLHGKLWTAFGWTVHITANPRFLRNYLMQANGAEMLRISCCELIERGIRVCAPVHDAILIEAKAEDLRDAVTRSQAVMARVSAAVLGGFALPSEAKEIPYPHRYMDERGKEMWDQVWDLMAQEHSLEAHGATR